MARRRAAARPDHRPRAGPRRRGMGGPDRPDLARPGHPLDLARAEGPRRRLRGRPARARPPARRPDRHLVAEPRRMGADAVRRRQGGVDPGDDQPGLPALRARVRAQQGRLRGAGDRDRRSRTATTSAWSTPWRPSSPPRCRASSPPRACRSCASWSRSADRRSPGAIAFDEVAALGGEAERADPARARGRAPVRRPGQHPVHQRHHRLAEGRHADAPQHPQQRLLRRPRAAADRGGPDLHPGAALPLLRHGHGQPRGADPWLRHGLPRRGLRPAGDARDGAGRAMHRALRRADDVHRRARPPGLRAASTSDRCAPASWRARPARSR